MEWMWAVWERSCRNFFHFASNSSSSEVKYRPYQERGQVGPSECGAVGLEERSVQMVRKDVCRWEQRAKGSGTSSRNRKRTQGMVIDGMPLGYMCCFEKC